MQKWIYEALNAMRGVAAIVVVLFHADHLVGVPLAAGGYLAVDLFFVLSGFVIAHAYDSKLANGLPVVEFARARIIRFYPMLVAGVGVGAFYAVFVIVVGGHQALSVPRLIVSAVTSLLFLPVPVDAHGDLFSLNVPLWTLSLELLVSLAYALTFRCLTTYALGAVAQWRSGAVAQWRCWVLWR